MFDPVSLLISAGIVWVGDKLLDKYKKAYRPKNRLLLA